MALTLTGGNLNGGKELGRISGPLLSADLRRNGVNLAIDTDKLYLNVVNKYVGFGTNIPTRTLTAPGTSRFARTNSALSDLIVTTQASIGNLTFNNSDKIQNFTNNNIIISPAAGDQLITFNGLGSTDYFAFLNNSLTGTTDTEINISPTGKTIINSSVDINGGLHAYGNLTWDGNITLGNDDTDNITLAADINSNIIPDVTDTYKLGSSLKKWKDLYSRDADFRDLFSTTATAGTWTQSGLTITTNSVSAGTGTLNITVSGTGKVNLHNKIYIKDNTITHNNAIVPLEIGNTGTGYTKFGGTRGVVMPSGTTLQRPAAAEIGTIRYNSNLNYIEVYANVANTQVVSLSTTSASGTLVLTQILNNPNPYGTSNGDQFGYSVAMSGDYVIVGAPYEDSGSYSSIDNVGRAYIYNRASGTLLHTLGHGSVLSGFPTQLFFGKSVAISGNYAIVGAPGVPSSVFRLDSGRIYIFDVTTGAELLTIMNPDFLSTSADDQFGYSVAISGNYIIVGSPFEDDTTSQSNNSGRAYIYNVTGGVVVYPIRVLNNPGFSGSTDFNDNFGKSVAISGNYAIVGAYREEDSYVESGKAYIFNVTTGALVHTLNNPNSYYLSANDWFGYSVAISGNYAVVGAPLEDDAGGSASGKAYIFNVTTGALVHTLNNPNNYGTSSNDQFGYSVAISNTYAIVGAYFEDDAGGTSSGNAYIFNVTTGALVQTLNNPNNYGTSSDDQFGYSVDISGNNAIVGAYQEDDASGLSSGKAYLYNSNLETILTTNTVGFNVGDFISSTSDLFAFATGTIITAVVPNTSITVSTPLLNILSPGSNLTAQRKWIPIIGTSPVLGVDDVNDIQDIWALILG